MTDESFWERCSSCKKPIAFGARYYLCSVSTCKHPRTGVRFCTPDCWDAHLGGARHREAWAEEAFAPRSSSTAPKSDEAGRAPVRRIVSAEPTSASVSRSSSEPAKSPDELDTLVVVSKVKQLIRDSSGFNTSQCCIEALTEKVAEHALKAIEEARSAGRKTVMGRDIR